MPNHQEIMNSLGLSGQSFGGCPLTMPPPPLVARLARRTLAITSRKTAVLSTMAPARATAIIPEIACSAGAKTLHCEVLTLCTSHCIPNRGSCCPKNLG